MVLFSCPAKFPEIWIWIACRVHIQICRNGESSGRFAQHLVPWPLALGLTLPQQPPPPPFKERSRHISTNFFSWSSCSVREFCDPIGVISDCVCTVLAVLWCSIQFVLLLSNRLIFLLSESENDNWVINRSASECRCCLYDKSEFNWKIKFLK